MGWRDEISEVVNIYNLTPSLNYWTKILNFFERNKDSLSLSDLETLAYESEKCRIHWNRDHEFTQIFTKNGKPHEQRMVRKGLGIEKEDVYPNIHQFMEQKVAEQIAKARLEEDDEDDIQEEKSTQVEAKLAAMPR